MTRKKMYVNTNARIKVTFCKFNRRNQAFCKLTKSLWCRDNAFGSLVPEDINFFIPLSPNIHISVNICHLLEEILDISVYEIRTLLMQKQAGYKF